jgi:6-methylsalicylate decarboxylase
MPRVDVHQHLWPEALVDGLARRDSAPRLRRSAGQWVLELAGEPPAAIDLDAQTDAAARVAQLERDGLDLALIAPSAPLGIEALAPDEAQPLLDAHNDGILELGGPFRLWAALHDGAGPAELGDLLDAGAIGLCLPASRLASATRLVEQAPLLSLLATRGAPLLVHPGAAWCTGDGAPSWWPAMTAYIAEMSAAWHAFAAWGRAAHPQLTVVWAMLAGGAPLHAERLAARGGPAGAVGDARCLYDISSYGYRAVDAMLRAVGVDRLLFGSDRPVVAPPDLTRLGPAVRHALAEANPAQLLPALPIPA